MSKSNKVTSKDYMPKRFGLKYDPPTIILEYLVPSQGKLFHHKMKMVELDSKSSTMDFLDYLKNKHAIYFLNNKIKDNQITELIERLKRRLPAKNASSAKNSSITSAQNTKPGSSSSYTPSTFSLGSTKPSSATTSLTSKQSMSLAPITTKPLSGGSGVSNNTNKIATKTETKKMDFDYDIDDFEEDDEEEDTYSKVKAQLKKDQDTKKTAPTSSITTTITSTRPTSAAAAKTATSNTQKAGGIGNFGWDEIEDDEDEQVDYNTFDLNKLSNEELKKHKDRMNETFNKNFKKPGDPGYVYDKQEVFDAQEDNEWDMDMDDDMDIV